MVKQIMISIKGIKFIGKSVFLEEEKILVLADIHLGYEASLNSQGILVPRTQFKEIMQDLENILNKIPKIEKIIILGDLKHEFGLISQQEWREVLKFLEALEQRTNGIVLIKGNHDTILGPIANRKDIRVVDSYQFKNYLFIHGNKPVLEDLNKEINHIFMGHIHPAITLRDGAKSERYKCFLVGEYKNKKIIVLPSFMPMIEGSDLAQYPTKIFNKISTKNFDVYAIEDEVYFLGNIRKE